MKLPLCPFVLAIMICGLSFGQSTTTQTAVNAGAVETGYAVITPSTGTGEGLSISEIFGEQIGGNLLQTSVIASPLVTVTDVVVTVDPRADLNTGIAIINPNATLATVTLNFRNQRGVTVATRTITIGAHQQTSRFVTELFSGDPVFAQPATGLLFINSDVSIGVVALFFNGNSFTSLPIAAQLTANSVAGVSAAAPAPATVTTTTTGTFNGVTVTPPPATFLPATPTFNGITMPPTILPTPATVIPVTGVATPVATTTGTATGISTTTTGTQVVTPVTATVFPQLTAGVGGPGALLLPQVATGGGWVTQITIANTSAVTQTVRLDLFDSSGTPLAVPSGSTVSGIVIAPGGVATLTL
jgi:hypothetical protein